MGQLDPARPRDRVRRDGGARDRRRFWWPVDGGLDACRRRRAGLRPGQPRTGPVFVRGSQPGRRARRRDPRLRPHAWGWTAIIPGFGLLADEFTEPWLRISQVDAPERPGSIRGRHHALVRSVPGHDRRRARRGRPATRSCRRAAGAGTWISSTCSPGCTLYLPGALSRPVLGRRHARGDGRRRGLRDRRRDRDGHRRAPDGARDVAHRLPAIRPSPPGSLPRPRPRAITSAPGFTKDLMEAAREAIRGLRSSTSCSDTDAIARRRTRSPRSRPTFASTKSWTCPTGSWARSYLTPSSSKRSSHGHHAK